MTDTDPGTAAPAPTTPAVTFDYAAYLAREAERNARAAELRPANKAALFDALAAADIVTVTVAFDGYGDSGQIESVDARDAYGEVALPTADIELATPSHEGAEVTRRTLPLAEAIEELCYDLLEEEHGGWENNDGAYGEFAFDVAARTINLDHNSRYTAVETYAHEW